MRKINLPNLDSKDIYKKVRNSRKSDSIKSDLDSIKSQVFARYDSYGSTSNGIDVTAQNPPLNLSNNEKNAICSSYSSSSFEEQRHVILKDTIICPYCNHNQVSTLDHYFPKSKYPEYSIFIPNLLPCCAKCNLDKGSAILDQNQIRKYIHFYYDDLPSYQFLIARFYYNTDKIVFDIDLIFHFNFGEPLEKIIRNHFKSLNLLERYKEIICTRLPAKVEEVKKYKNIFSIKKIKKILEIQYDSAKEHDSLIDCLILEGMLHSKNFLESVLIIDCK